MTIAEQIERYVGCVYDPADIVEVRALRTGEQPQQLWLRASELSGRADHLAKLNNAGLNIYVGANPRPAKGATGNACIKVCRTLFVDFDKIKTNDGESPSEIVLGKIEEAGLPQPSFVLFSGHGIHAYWRLTEPLPPDRWRGLQERLIAALHSDPAIKNAERIMRLPGFANLKYPDKPVDCFIVDSRPDVVYPLAEIEARLPKVEKPVPVKASPPTGGIIPKGQRDNTLTSLAGTMRKRGMTPAAILAALREENQRCEEPLPEKDIERIAKSIGKKPPATPDPDAQPVYESLIVRVSRAGMRRVRWLVPDHFALGKLSIIAGLPGTSKSLFSVYLIAGMQHKVTLPDLGLGIPATIIQGDALLVTCEDDPEDTIAPRFAAYGVDPESVPIYRGTRLIEPDGTVSLSLFDMNTHLGVLEAFLTQNPTIRLLVLDPVQTFLGNTEMNHNTRVNETLTELGNLAQRCHVAVIIITHFNKKSDESAMDRVIGSRGFSGTVRAMWNVTPDRETKGRFILSCVKQQNSAKPNAMAYNIRTRPVLIEGEEERIPILEFEPNRLDVDADDLVSPNDGKLRVDACADWLKARLAAGAVLSTTVFDDAEAEGFNRDLCHRAKAHLHVRVAKQGFGGKWFWSLPGREDGQRYE